MAWLGTWEYRTEITASNTNIDSDLTHFPLLLTLSTSAGTGGDDVSFIFDELASDANRFKIAVTEDDGMTQAYVEIQEWDDANETAYLWISSSGLTLSSSGTTTLYLYYDSTQPDNTTYVGDVGSTPGETVWDSDFLAVWHMETTNPADSTDNNRDGIGTGVTTSAGQIGTCLSFDDTDYVSVSGGFSNLDALTVELWMYDFSTSAPSSGTPISNFPAAGTAGFGMITGNWWMGDDISWYGPFANRQLPSTYWQYYTMTKTVSSGPVETFRNATSIATSVDFIASYPTPENNVLEIGRENRDNVGKDISYINALVDEVRISNTQRSDAWIKATYHSGDDNLVSWGNEEPSVIVIEDLRVRSSSSSSSSVSSSSSSSSTSSSSSSSSSSVSSSSSSSSTSSSSSSSSSSSVSSSSSSSSVSSSSSSSSTSSSSSSSSTSSSSSSYSSSSSSSSTSSSSSSVSSSSVSSSSVSSSSSSSTPWLSGGWTNRVKIMVSDTNIDSDLTHFPLLLTLSTSAGTGGDDVSFIFDELTSDDNRKKIAVTNSDGSQVYVEIQEWDDASEEAYLWVSRSTLILSSSADTTLFFYYDSGQPDNTTYVGDKESTPAETVWDSNFIMVQHMNEASGNIVDSTLNDNDSDVVDGTPTYAATGQIGDCIDFPGNAGFEIPDKTQLDLTTAFTLQAWVKNSETGSYPTVMSKGGGPESWIMFIWSDASPPNGSQWGMVARADTGTQYNRVGTTDVTDDAWHHCAGIFNSSANTLEMFRNGSQEGGTTTTSGTLNTNTNKVTIGMYDTGTVFPYEGLIDEVRISNVARSDTWIKAEYYSQDDNLVNWGSGESSSSSSSISSSSSSSSTSP